MTIEQLRTWWSHIPTRDPLRQQQAAFFQVFLLGWIFLATVGLPLNFLRGAGGEPASTPPTRSDSADLHGHHVAALVCEPDALAVAGDRPGSAAARAL